MKIRKVAFGNSSEAFVEDRFSDGVNIISSDDNNKGKTIVIQSMMYALGNEPTFPTSFKYRRNYYYVEFEEDGKMYKMCRSVCGFILKQGKSIFMFDNVSELKRHWSKYIFQLPTIVKNNSIRVVDPVLFLQLFFVGQDKKETSDIVHHGFYNKKDFVEMLYSLAKLGGEQLSLSREMVDEIKNKKSLLEDEKEVLYKQYKILKSKKIAISYLCAESDRLAFREKLNEMEHIQATIYELRRSRNASAIRKCKWEQTIGELRSLNRAISCGELRCLDCNSKRISIGFGDMNETPYSFDVSTKEMRERIIDSISEKIASYREELEKVTEKINEEQEKLKSLMSEGKVSLESIVQYRQNILTISEAETRIKEINSEIKNLSEQMSVREMLSKKITEARVSFMQDIVDEMNKLYLQIDPEGNIRYAGLFTKQNEVYSGSEATVFHLVKLFALQHILKHDYPIVMDSFRAEDLSTEKESMVIQICEAVGNQIILTTTLKQEEMGKYDLQEKVNHINYFSHASSKILDGKYLNEFRSLMSDLSVTI